MSFDQDLSSLDPRVLAALLVWQADAGVDEAWDEAPIDRFAHHAAQQEAAAAARAAAPQAAPGAERPRDPKPFEAPPPPPKVDPVAEARRIAAAAPDLAGLARALQDFPHCDLKRGARNFLFREGHAAARVLWITDPPGLDEDKAGQLFAGAAGDLFGRMLAAIGLSREGEDPQQLVAVAPLIPWPLRGSRTPEPQLLEMMVPFLSRQIELSAPAVVVLAGHLVAQAFLGRSGITSLRGTQVEVMGRPAIVSLPPSLLLQNPYLKRGSWEDLLALKARLT